MQPEGLLVILFGSYLLLFSSFLVLSLLIGLYLLSGHGKDQISRLAGYFVLKPIPASVILTGTVFSDFKNPIVLYFILELSLPFLIINSLGGVDQLTYRLAWLFMFLDVARWMITAIYFFFPPIPVMRAVGIAVVYLFTLVSDIFFGAIGLMRRRNLSS